MCDVDIAVFKDKHPSNVLFGYKVIRVGSITTSIEGLQDLFRE